MSQIKSYLEAITATYKAHAPVYARVLVEHGKTFKPNAECRAYMTPKQCYGNATEKAINDERFTYAEGLGIAAKIGVAIPLHHAWLVNAHGQAHDPTWGDTFGNEYFGVMFSRDFILEFVERTGHVSVFESLYLLRMTPEACYDYVVSGVVTPKV